MKGLTQLRRDHYLSAAKGLSVDDLRELRHSPIIGLSTLFPEAALRELNEKHHKALQTKALFQSTTRKETPKKAVTRPKPSYDHSQQNWCVFAPACVFSSVASLVVSEGVRGSPGGPPAILWMPVLWTLLLLRLFWLQHVLRRLLLPRFPSRSRFLGNLWMTFPQSTRL